MIELRRVEKKVGGIWVLSSMEELRMGDLFRMFNPTGEAVYFQGTQWVAMSNPYEAVNENGVKTWTIEVEDKDEE